MHLFFYKKKCDAADSPFFLITSTSKSVNKLCVNKRAGVVAHKEEKDIAQRMDVQSIKATKRGEGGEKSF